MTPHTAPQYSSYRSILQLFNQQLFSPIFNTDFDDYNTIFLSWKIKYSTYEITIFNDGEIECSIFNSQSKDVLNNCELETFYNMINQAHITYSDKSKLWRYVTVVLN